MKKLVKTAKQQFEERLSELNIFNHQSLDLNEIFYCGLNSDNQFIMLLNDGDANYMESGFIDEYEAVVTSEKFLSAMIERFNEGKREIKPLFDWYASADHEITESSPLDLRDLFNLGIEEAFYQFEDLYEEVPDVRIITAKEQWEEDSKDFTTQENEGDYPFKVVTDDESLRFYYYEYGYYCDIYPPLESLRKNDLFIKDITDRLLEFAEYEGVGRLQDWIRVGGDFPLSFGWIFYSEYPRADVIAYEDKELHQEQTIEQMIALTPEQQEAVRKFEEAAQTLKDSGVKVICYHDQNEYYVINGKSKLNFDHVMCCGMDEYNGYKDISSIIENNHVLKFSWDLYWGCDCSFCAKRI